MKVQTDTVEFEDLRVSRPQKDSCPSLPGTLLRIFIPAGAVINLLNLIELHSPSGICLIIRVPILSGLCGGNDLKDGFKPLLDAIKSAGGTIEIVNE
ncbi:MAG: hypothetical protein ACOX6S_10840 [Clostridia bacterium]